MASKPKTTKTRAREPKAAPGDELPPRIDGRTLRRTNRTIQLATKITPELDRELREAAARDGKMIVEILEEGFRLYESRAKKAQRRG